MEELHEYDCVIKWTNRGSGMSQLCADKRLIEPQSGVIFETINFHAHQDVVLPIQFKG